MPSPASILRLLGCVSCWTVGLLAAAAQEPTLDPAGEAFFESKIRPLLVERCLECHSQETEASGGLLLDSREGWLRGGDSGPAILFEASGESPLLRAVEYNDPHLQMPPDGKLSDAQLQALRTWIEMKAPDPRVSSAPLPSRNAAALPLERAREHWAYRPLNDSFDVPLPAAAPSSATAETLRPSTAIDAFLNRDLAANQLVPLGSVSRRALLRRLTLDLHGLMPTAQELEAFERDSRPDAVQRQVDRMLASPRFAERFARHWLDVARFGESLTLRGLVLPNAWRYRDFVIDAFDVDMDFDQFVQWQVAGDLLAQQESLPSSLQSFEWRQHQMAAVSYLALGNSNLEEQDKKQLEMDIVDEQLDVLGKGLLGQTISCARCHDHKFDPIPTADYYALAGILKGVQTVKHANVSEWIDIDLPLSPQEQQQLAQIQQQLAARREQLRAIDLEVASLKTQLDGTLPAELADAPIPVSLLPGIVLDDGQATAVGEWTFSQYSKRYIGDGYRHDGNTGQGTKTLTFAPEGLPPGNYAIRLAFNHGPSRASAVPITVFSADGEKLVHVNQKQTPPIEGRWASLGEFRFEAGGQAHLIISNEATDGHVIVDAVQFLRLDPPVGDQNPDKTPSEATAEANELKQQFDAKQKERQSLAAEIKRFEGEFASRPRAVGVIETGRGADLPIHVRGSVHSLGSVVPRGFLQAVSVDVPRPQGSSSGRLELAQWLTSPEQPLTHRVIVNRLWQWALGQGLVRTPDNFGTTGDAPTHAELLDYLVARWRLQEQSPKALLRRLVLTDAYARAWANSPEHEAIDPGNRWWWRAERKRLDAESLRDTMLSVSDELWLRRGSVPTPASLKEDYGFASASPYRSVYLPAFRNAPDSMLAPFDLADPSVVVGQRNQSIVAPQALALLHHPWVHERAAHTAQLLLTQPNSSAIDSEQAASGADANVRDEIGNDDAPTRQQLAERFIERATQRLLGREPTSNETDSMRVFLLTQGFASGQPDLDQMLATELVHVLMASIEFRFLE